MEKKKKRFLKVSKGSLLRVEIIYRERKLDYILVDLWNKVNISERFLKGYIFWFRIVLLIFFEYGVVDFNRLWFFFYWR